MKDVLEVKLHVRDLIMMILFAKEIYKVGINLFKILNGIFYKKKNEFLHTKSKHLQWSTQFLKFTVRISSKLPRVQNNLEQGNNNKNNKLRFIKNQLNFINNVLTPFFSQRQVISKRRETSRDKLIDLWINKRSEAIQMMDTGLSRTE